MSQCTRKPNKSEEKTQLSEPSDEPPPTYLLPLRSGGRTQLSEPSTSTSTTTTSLHLSTSWNKKKAKSTVTSKSSAQAYRMQNFASSKVRHKRPKVMASSVLLKYIYICDNTFSLHSVCNHSVQKNKVDRHLFLCYIAQFCCERIRQ